MRGSIAPIDMEAWKNERFMYIRSQLLGGRLNEVEASVEFVSCARAGLSLECVFNELLVPLANFIVSEHKEMANVMFAALLLPLAGN